jgi:hypothetical protein
MVDERHLLREPRRGTLLHALKTGQFRPENGAIQTGRIAATVPDFQKITFPCSSNSPALRQIFRADRTSK